jgi:Inner membrane component of T3SS, cytoplasmic domain
MSPQDPASVPTLFVMQGRRAGERVAVPNGRSTIGRDPASSVVFDDDGVSRRHAALTSAHGFVTVEDAGSTNGTWVNGERVGTSRRLAPGDELRVGVVGVRFEAAAPVAAPVAPATAPASGPAPRRGRVRLGRVVLVGGLANLVLLAAGVVIQFATDWTGIGPWLAAPLVGMVAALVDVGKQAATRDTAPAPASAPAAGVSPTADTGTISPPKRRVPIVVGVGVAVLLIGGGGLAIAYGVATVTAFITGNQTGTERLVGGPVVMDTQGVSTTVRSVEHTQDFTRVEITVQNGLPNTITLPVFNNATLTAADGTTLGADPFRSSWNQTIAPGQPSSGVLVFGGHLPPSETTAALAFATVFEQGFEGPSSIVVGGLVIAPFDG